jgi:hypothetical protein
MALILSLLRFHWSAGARVALRANAIVGGSALFFYGILAPDGAATLRKTVLSIVAAGHEPSDRWLIAAFAIALAATAAPRVVLGASGWMRSLPSDAATHRRAALLALSLSQALAIVFVVAGAIATVTVYRAPLSASKLASIPLLLLASSLLVLRVRRWSGRAFAMIALWLAVEGTWPFIGAGLLALIIGDTLSGALVAKTPRARRTKPLPRSAIVAWARIGWRTLPAASIASAFVLPIIFVGFAYLFVRNNADLATATISRSGRITGVLALASSIATIGNTLLRARPSWAWSRSLPWSSMQRVSSDALLIGVPLLLIPIALLPVSIGAAVAMALMIPPTAACCASALRVAAGRQTGAAGESVAFVLLSGTVVSIWPLASIAVCALAAPLLRLGAERERRFVATRWVELQHDAAGDPTWMGAT